MVTFFFLWFRYDRTTQITIAVLAVLWFISIKICAFAVLPGAFTSFFSCITHFASYSLPFSHLKLQNKTSLKLASIQVFCKTIHADVLQKN